MIFESQHLHLVFRDTDGCLVSIKNKDTGRVYTEDSANWISVVFDEGTSDIWDSRPNAETARTISAVGHPATIAKDGDTLNICHTVKDGVASIVFEEKISFTEDGNRVNCVITVKNESGTGVVVNLTYPDVTGIKGGDDSLYFPIMDGSDFKKAFLTPEEGSDFTTENKIQFRSTIGDNDTYTEDVIVMNYPVPLAATLFAVHNDKEHFYLAHHDKDHAYKQLGFEKVGRMFIRNWPFLAPGQSSTLEPFCLGIGAGDWHKAADVYNAWKKTLPQVGPGRTERGKNIAGMAVYQCVSYPEYLHLKYTEDAPGKTVLAPADMSCRCLNADGIGTDFDTFGKAAIRARDNAGSDLVLFIGWHVGGLDAYYPDYEPVEALGGKEGLRKAIEEVHAAGMKAIFYVNVHIADRAAKWFNTPGYNTDRMGIDCAIKKPDGDVWIERYPGTSRQYFVAQCPMAKPWTKAAVEAMRTVMELGADGIYFDELMTMPAYLCYDRSHGHATPATAFHEGYKEFFAEVYDMIKQYRPDDYICGCEGVGDAYDAYIDIMCMHWWRKWGNPKFSYGRPEVLRYIMGRPMLGMQASGECGDNMAGYAFTMFDPLLEHPYVYPTAKRYHALHKAYPEIYRDGKFMDVVGLAGIPANVRKGIMCSADKKTASIHVYNTSYNPVTFNVSVDAAELGLPAGLKAYDAESGEAISFDIALAGKEKKAILLK